MVAQGQSRIEGKAEFTKHMIRMRHVGDDAGTAMTKPEAYKEGCSASAARQAVGGSRGAVVKPRTLQGPSTGSCCGWVVCPRWAWWAG